MNKQFCYYTSSRAAKTYTQEESKNTRAAKMLKKISISDNEKRTLERFVTSTFYVSACVKEIHNTYAHNKDVDTHHNHIQTSCLPHRKYD